MPFNDVNKRLFPCLPKGYKERTINDLGGSGRIEKRIYSPSTMFQISRVQHGKKSLKTHQPVGQEKNQHKFSARAPPPPQIICGPPLTLI